MTSVRDNGVACEYGLHKFICRWCDATFDGRTPSGERAEGPPDLTDLQSLLERAEKAERERDEALAKAKQFACEGINAESALAHERAMHLAAERAADTLIAEERRNTLRIVGAYEAHSNPEVRLVARDIAHQIRTLASGNAPPPQDSPILSSCSPDCTTGPEGGVLHSVEHQYRLAGGSIKTCPVCGEERHGGTCADAAFASGERPAGPPTTDNAAGRLRRKLDANAEALDQEDQSRAPAARSPEETAARHFDAFHDGSMNADGDAEETP